MGEPEAPMMEDKDDKHVVMKDGKFYTGIEFVSDIKDAMKYNLKSATEVAKREKGIVYTPKKINEDEISKDEILAARLYKIKNHVQPAFFQKIRMMINNGNLEKAEEFISRMEPVAAKKGTEFAAMKGELDSLEEKKLTKAEKEKERRYS